MKSILPRPSAVAALLYASAAYGSAIQYCPSSAGGICYQVAVPQASASSDSGDIYFQISAPTSFQWVALGTGTRMAGSNIFLMYQDGSGNLTLSPRLGTQHTMPTLDTSSTAAQLTLLAGSGVSGSTMTANVACANCQSWNGGSGSMSLSSTGTPWIAAWKSGSSLATTDQSASISQHDSTASFSLDLTKAAISSDSNPFVSSASSASGSPGNSSSGSGSNGNGGSSSNGSGVTVQSGVIMRGSTLVAHGVIMALVMVILYPVGSLLMPMFRLWWAHALFQTATFVLMWVGFGLGVKVANDCDLLFKQAHTIFGTAITCLFVVQPVLGYVHHLQYKRLQARGPVSHAHIWYGRVVMLMGVINGGIGLNLVGEKHSMVVTYSVVAAIIGVLYIGVKAGTTLVRRRSAARGNDGDAKDNPDISSSNQANMSSGNNQL